MALTRPELVARIISGDRSAEEELVRRYSPGMFTIIRHMLGNSPTVEDLVQESLAIAIAKVRRGQVREPEHVFGFLCSLARNVAIAHLRRPAHRGIIRAGRAAPPGLDPFEELAAKEQADAVRRVLAEMSSTRDRELLYRFYIAEEAKDAICCKLGLSSLHFNRVLYRARERFRNLYQRFGCSPG